MGLLLDTHYALVDWVCWSDRLEMPISKVVESPLTKGIISCYSMLRKVFQ